MMHDKRVQWTRTVCHMPRVNIDPGVMVRECASIEPDHASPLTTPTKPNETRESIPILPRRGESGALALRGLTSYAHRAGT